MTESFPRQEARTRRFTLGVPRAFRVSPDGTRVVFLRTKGGADPVTCLWALDVASGHERLVADPRTLGADQEDLPPQERARRERVREQAGGIVAYAADDAVTVAVFALSGHVYAVPLTGGDAAYQVATRTPALDPRPDPAGRQLAYVCDGALRVTGLRGDLPDRAVADPRGAPGVTFGLPEFIAAEEMDRHRGYWWAPDGSALLVARVDETPVTRWHIADPAHPERVPAEVAYPAAGTPNADVTLLLARLDGQTVPVQTDPAAFPYLVTAGWQDGHDPLVVVQSRDQRAVRILGVDVASGQTRVLHEDTDPVLAGDRPGRPGLDRGRPDRMDSRRAGHPPPGPARSGPLARGRDPAGPAGPRRARRGRRHRAVPGVRPRPGRGRPVELRAGLSHVGEGGGFEAGTRAGGTTVTSRRALDADGVTVRVSRSGGGPAVNVASLAEPPALPAPRPVLFRAGPREIQTAVLFPSWHQAGQGPLPVLLDPYGGPHAQRVLRTRGAYLVPQWFAEQGFAVVIADGRGTPARGPAWERAVAGDLAGPVLEDQVDALAAAAARFGDLDTGRVAIRGWSFGGYLAALAVLRRPDVFHAAIAGAPVTDWRLYDTHYTERYLGLPGSNAEAYDRSGLILLAERSVVSPRPLMLIHGLADDNVVVAHTLRLSAALLAAGYPHEVLPLTGITHMASQETVAENLLLLQLDFLRRSVARVTHHDEVSITPSPRGLE